MNSELFKLSKILDEHNIEWRNMSDPRVMIERIHFIYKGYKWAAVYDYGYREGLIVLMSNAINGGEPVGNLTASQVEEYLKNA